MFSQFLIKAARAAAATTGQDSLLNPDKGNASINWNLDTVKTFAKGALNIGFGFVGLVALIYIIIGGYSYLVSSGNEEQAEKGKKTILYAIIGLVVVVSAWAIVNFAADLLGKPNYHPGG